MAPNDPVDDARVSRRALFGGQLARWAAGQLEPEPAPPRAPDRTRAIWDRDGHEPLLRALTPVAEALVELAGVRKRARVLDVGAGDGNVALACVRREAIVTACDLSPRMVLRGRARCPLAGWSTGDARDLPHADGVFDMTLSAFGATLSPNPRAVARELTRVTVPGGVVAIAAWASPDLPWGEEPAIRAQLDEHLEELELTPLDVALRLPSADLLRGRFDALPAPDGDGPIELDARCWLVRGRRPIPMM